MDNRYDDRYKNMDMGYAKMYGPRSRGCDWGRDDFRGNWFFDRDDMKRSRYYDHDWDDRGKARPFKYDCDDMRRTRSFDYDRDDFRRGCPDPYRDKKRYMNPYDFKKKY